MQVHHLSTSSTGGAGIAASRLSDGLSLLGVESSIIVKHPEKRAYKQCIRLFWEKLESIKRKKLKLTEKYEILNFHNDARFLNIDEFMNCDLINLHWVSSFIHWRRFLTHKKLPPIVWTLHDMHIFQGLAHYAEDAHQLRQEIAQGRAIDDMSCRDIDHKVWQEKKYLLARSTNQIHFVTPSKWLADEARQSFLKDYPISVIPNGIDTTILKPVDLNFGKELLNIPQNSKKNILFVADSLENKRKGIEVLTQALALISQQESYQLLVMGTASELALESLNVIQLGYISDDRLKACAYSAADLFIIPSREDNLPNTVLESLACGTPVIGSNVGGIPDMVRPGITGELFGVGDAVELAQKIESWFERDDLQQISANCRDIAVKEYDLSVQAQAYEKLYIEILKKNP